MRHRLAVAALALTGTLLLTSPSNAGSTIDLDQPDALVVLQQANPAHYAKVRLILEGAARNPRSDLSRWARVAFDARDVDYPPIVLTSHPAKRRLAFSLDDTRYVATVVLTDLRGAVTPAK
jgi:hypothetical protein